MTEKPRQSDIQRIRDALETLNGHRFVRINNSPGRMLWFQFMRGLAFGLGSVLGATIVVSILLAVLAQIEFIPIIGEWAKQIMMEIQRSH